MASNTGSSSPGELEMTFSTSEVAVCCSSARKIVGALAQLVEQARVLDGDDGLRGEVLDQLDLLVGEGPHFLAIDRDRADQLVVLEHRHIQQSPESSEIDGGHEDRLALDIGCLGSDVGDMDGLLRLDGASKRGARPGALRTALPELGKLRRYADHRRRAARAPSSMRNNMPKLASQMRIAFSSMAWNTGSSSPGELEMTFSTSEVAVCCSSASESSRCAAQLVEQPRVLDGDHGLGGEVLHQLDLLVGERPRLPGGR